MFSEMLKLMPSEYQRIKYQFPKTALYQIGVQRVDTSLAPPLLHSSWRLMFKVNPTGYAWSVDDTRDKTNWLSPSFEVHATEKVPKEMEFMLMWYVLYFFKIVLVRNHVPPKHASQHSK